MNVTRFRFPLKYRADNSEVQKIQPTYIDEFGIDHDLDQDRFEEVESDFGTPPATSFAASSNPSSRRPLPTSTPRAYPRRELIWKYQKHETVSLENIASQFQDFLRTSSAKLAFNHRRGRYTTKTAHRCPGYNRIEITLTTDIARSAIVSHLTPTPHEICPVCKETVKDAETFACICGGDGECAHKHKPFCVLELTSRADIESIPTIRCLICSEWHHRPCVNIFEDESRHFECQHCQAGPPAVQGLSSSFIDPGDFSAGSSLSSHPHDRRYSLFPPDMPDRNVSKIPSPCFPIEEQPLPPPPKPKRKRKYLREKECSFCQGSEKKNKAGEPESMLTCCECGRSCMALSSLLVRTPNQCNPTYRSPKLHGNGGLGGCTPCVSMEMYRV